MISIAYLIFFYNRQNVKFIFHFFIFFYISNEGVSLLENAAHLGLPVPQKIKAVLEQLHDRAEDEEERA